MTTSFEETIKGQTRNRERNGQLIGRKRKSMDQSKQQDQPISHSPLLKEKPFLRLEPKIPRKTASGPLGERFWEKRNCKTRDAKVYHKKENATGEIAKEQIFEKV